MNLFARQEDDIARRNWCFQVLGPHTALTRQDDQRLFIKVAGGALPWREECGR
jgi:hypothetical protein